MRAANRKVYDLPLKNLNWNLFTDLLDEAHLTLKNFNEVLTGEVISKLIHQEAIASAKSKKKQNILVYERALRKSVARIKTQAFSYRLICQMHKDINIKTLYPKRDQGKFRDRQNWIGHEGCSIEEAYFFPPDVASMKRAMANLKAYFFYKEKDPLIQLAIFVGQMLIIHPFMDGNGRVARMLIPVFLYKKKLISEPYFYLSSYFKKHNKKYHRKLNKLTTNKGWEEWIIFFLKGIIEQNSKNG